MGTPTAHGLPSDWILAPGFDLELKQYVLLGYKQRVQARFGQHKLYPHLDELRGHLERLRVLRQQRADLSSLLDREVIGLDIERAELVRARHEEHALLRVIDEVLAFAIPELQAILGEGNELRQELSAHIHFTPVGLLPLHAREGYLLLRQGREVRVYSYQVPLLRYAAVPEHRSALRTNYLATFPIGLTHTYEQIKTELVRSFRQLPNPATFAFETDITLPHIETFMPLAKQLVVDHLVRTAA